METNPTATYLRALGTWLVVAAVLAFAPPVRVQSDAGPSARQQGGQGITAVKPEQAEENLVEKVAPVYPPLAKQARIQGKVRMQIVISSTGSVDSITVLSGHPLLVQAAINAVKQWHYKPFLVKGQAISVRTEVEVPFSLGISDAQVPAEQKSSQDYFKREDECRSLLQARKYAEAEAACKSAVELADRLPLGRQNERRTANGLAGHALFAETRFDEALTFFKKEVAIGEATLSSTDAELGYAYHDLALGFHAIDDLQKAQLYYEKAESTLWAAREHIHNEFLENEYAKAIQSVLRDYIALLKQTGQEDAAARAQKRSEALAREIRPVGTP